MTIRKHEKNEKKIFAFLLLSALYAGAQEVPDWENPIVVGINKEPYHATLTLPSQKVDCKEIISLNGKWRFQWSADPGKRPADFYKNDSIPTHGIPSQCREHGNCKVMGNLSIPT